MSRRQFFAAGAAVVAGVALWDRGAARAAGPASACDGSCSSATAWMLDADWGYPRGPHGKTRLVSRASRNAAANRIARTEQEALDMNLHVGSWAPAVSVQICQHRLDEAFASYGASWHNPWNGVDVNVLDLRRVPAALDVFTCSASEDAGSGSPAAHGRGVPVTPAAANSGAAGSVAAARANGAGSTGGIAYSGSDRRLLVLGVGAIAAGTVLRVLKGGRIPLSEDSKAPAA